ncbi:MAG: hypothetical protein J6D11_05460 [Clostridia bacterium]|nr:hypothetical protein [Clostridia bacterium]
MKKIISILVAVMMIVSLFAVPAFAYDIDASSGNDTYEGAIKDAFGGSTSADVQIQINGDVNHRYAVDITFDAQIFTLSTGATWHPERHEYIHDLPVTWNGEGTVTVANHSDMPITYEATAAVTTDEYGPLSIVFNGAATYAPIPETRIEGCTVGGVAPKGDFTYGVVGTPIVAQLAATKLGTVTVTVDAVD